MQNDSKETAMEQSCEFAERERRELYENVERSIYDDRNIEFDRRKHLKRPIIIKTKGDQK